LLCVDDECCTQPNSNQGNVPNLDERQRVANKCPSGVFTVIILFCRAVYLNLKN